MKKNNILIFIIALFFAYTGNLYPQFGKNKVQYENFDWKYVQTVNFDVYYNDGSKYLADFTARACENSLAAIVKTLNHRMSSRVAVIVYDAHNDFQQTNVIMQFMPEGVGGVTELFKNRVVVPFQGNWAVLDHVIHHELVHAVLNDMFYGGTFQSAISSSGGFMIPLWMNEGFAEWQSIGGMNTETDMFMRDLTLSENLPPLNRLNGYLAYRGGQTFYNYVAETYGKERVGDLINRLRIYRNVETAFASTFQMSFEDFSEKWQRDIKKFYFPDLELFVSPKDYAIPLTNHQKDMTFYNSSPAISPDGEKMAYISTSGGVFGIFVRNIDDKTDAKQLVSSSRTQDFEDLNMLTPGISWNPKGTHLAISAKAGAEDAIFIVDAKTGKYDRLKFGIKSISSVQWSQENNEIAFIGSQGKHSDIYVYNYITKKLKQITDDIFSVVSISWSFDGKRIYFTSDRSNNLSGIFNMNNFKIWNYDVYKSDIFVIDIATSNIERLTFDPENTKTSIAVVPGDDKLLYVSDKNGIGNIYVMDLFTKKSKPLTNSLTGITQIAISNDASKALFTTQINGGYDIYMMKYPLDSDLGIDELPLTKFRQSQIEQKKIIESIAEIENAGLQETKLTGYGDFEVTFENQAMVSPNVDAQKNLLDDNTTSIIQISDDASSADTTDEELEEQDYKVTFSPDLILGNPGFSTFFGVQGVTQMLFSDVLGDHQIFFQANLLLDLRNSQFFLAYNYLPKIIDYSFNIYHTSAFILSADNFFYRFRNFGAGVTASYPFTLFNRLEFGANFMMLSKENVDIPELGGTDRYLVVPRVRYVHDNTLWGYYGPRDGSRYFLDISGSPKLGDDGVGFATFRGDYRTYIPLGWFFGFALRGAAGASLGPNSQNFFMGGTDNWINRRFSGGRLPFNSPEDFAFMAFEMPMRGWAVSEVVGDKYFIANAEFRFPLLTALIAGPLPILIQGVNGAIFLDVGSAWYDEVIFSQTLDDGRRIPGNMLMSSGLGIRAYMLGIPWKVDIAWRNEIDRWSEPYYLFSIGFDF
ncbi:MAG: PD40 domain-containing protein [Candidatus Kapabacteria bacterium]|nr:PD40 domain-containing protein [Ignavibacteriota bacterium]MCW5886231.1 PD40 domain-containing protein [Candidatus Kapabacteria bacterium]